MDYRNEGAVRSLATLMYYNDELVLCKLEDFGVGSFLDPRYKALSFKHLEKWDKGMLTKERVIEWCRAAYNKDWRPSREKSVCKEVNVPRAAQKKQMVSFLEDSDDEDAEEVEPELRVDTAECEFALYLATPPASMSEDPVHQW
ncbi:hypothetical protein CYMTET_43874 [Cymbomonas tetramitiformis]|uniref:Uncharacterized protein n=1 Tax=Cymbomonas tetramitiformis TaxID=36881 RepID=A0AAE0F187_9CHLO|nr:hypothetical protein CYMTET_43874 [Cymbomonas tetramitiformis]